METKGIQQFVNSYSVKMIVIMGLALILLIPSVLIQEIIGERIAQSERVKTELYAQWGGEQVVSGPVLNVPYTIYEQADGNLPSAVRHGIAHFLPETLKVDGDLLPEKRKRSIYTVMVYEGSLKISGNFAVPEVARLEQANAIYQWQSAYFTVGITDMRGIKNLPVLTLNQQPLVADPGVADNDLFASGLTFASTAVDPTLPMQFDFELILKGSENLSIEVIGKTSEVKMQSTWSEPTFTGGYLPDQRDVSAEGFSAEWKVTHLNRNFPQQWADSKFSTSEAVVGVGLLIPVDHYLKSMRSAKYAILFIALNFIVFLFIELKSKTRIHPFQYTLVAMALLLFYALLTSLGEQIGFNVAYGISAALITALITWYTASIVSNKRTLGGIALLQGGLYLFLFVILQLQEFALLVGSAGLFLILAIVMRASQKIIWYSEG